MSPRISFSNDFAESSSHHHHHHHHSQPSSTDFEFNVTSNNSLQLSPADELFFKGRILPFQRPPPPPPPPTSNTTTLRDELLVGEDEDEDEDDVFSLKPPQSHKGRWKGFLGLRKSYIGSKKPDPSPLRSFHNEPTNFFSFPLQDHLRSPQVPLLNPL